jgi:flagellar biosynthesis anti-sigma factor FlgM
MRIGSYTKVAEQTSTGASTSLKKAGEQGKPSQAGATKASGDGIKLTVSAQARALAAQADQGFDAAKVERLKGAMASGAFKVDASAIGARIAEAGG